MYQEEDVLRAIKVKNALFDNDGVLDIKEFPELYEYYMDENVEGIINLLMLESKLEIKQVESKLYLIPQMGNKIYGMTDEYYKVLYGTKSIDKEGMYLSGFILMVILSKIYAGKGENAKLLTHISVEMVLEEINKIFLEVEKYDVKEIEYENEINIRSIKKRWESLSVRYPNRMKPKIGKTKYAAIIRSVEVFKKQGLLKYLEEEEIIKPEKKLDDLMRCYYLDYDRKELIDTLLKKYAKEDS